MAILSDCQFLRVQSFNSRCSVYFSCLFFCSKNIPICSEVFVQPRVHRSESCFCFDPLLLRKSFPPSASSFLATVSQKGGNFSGLSSLLGFDFHPDRIFVVFHFRVEQMCFCRRCCNLRPAIWFLKAFQYLPQSFFSSLDNSFYLLLPLAFRNRITASDMVCWSMF